MAVMYGVLHGQRRYPAQRLFHPRLTMVGLRDQEVISRYRLSRPMINDLVHLIRADIDPMTNRGMGIDAETKVLLTLRYLAKGDFFSEVGYIHGVSKSSMSRHLHDVVLAINNSVDNIRFPEIDVERRSTATAFYRLSRIPRVLGAIDCTLIPITTPTSHEASYVCRKGYHALNVQAVVDTKLRFIDAVARWPGATNDATIFEMSGLKDYLEANAVGVLLGDSGYALRNYLLTPILRPTANAQVAYNDAHARGRVVVERAFGVLKSRFRCLHRSGGCLMFSPAKCQQIVICCMKLHNLCIDNGVDFNEQVIPDDQPDTFQPVAEVGLVHHQTCRNAVVQSFT